ncbi:MAG TPA: hypothetical protein ENJ28_09385 [Gammaproteobacteria bacterium]|nr:hypothetical protein [Gammaproteobacteria bacterium]
MQKNTQQQICNGKQVAACQVFISCINAHSLAGWLVPASNTMLVNDGILALGLGRKNRFAQQ